MCLTCVSWVVPVSFLSVVILPAANVVRLLWILRTPRLVGGLMRCMRVKDVLSGQAAEESTDQTTVGHWGGTHSTTHSLAHGWLAGWAWHTGHSRQLGQRSWSSSTSPVAMEGELKGEGLVAVVWVRWRAR